MDHDNELGLLAAAEELISAIHAKDEHAVADAFKALFTQLESQPHEEWSPED